MRKKLLDYLMQQGLIQKDEKEIYDYGLYVIELNLVGNGSVLLLSLILHQF